MVSKKTVNKIIAEIEKEFSVTASVEECVDPDDRYSYLAIRVPLEKFDPSHNDRLRKIKYKFMKDKFSEELIVMAKYSA